MTSSTGPGYLSSWFCEAKLIYYCRLVHIFSYGIHLTKFDQNGDNEIDYEEFLLLVCRRILREKAIAIDIDLLTGKKITKTERGTEFRIWPFDRDNDFENLYWIRSNFYKIFDKFRFFIAITWRIWPNHKKKSDQRIFSIHVD